MAVNKVVFGAVAIMDISDSTVTEDTLAEGAIAYGADGERIRGKMQSGVELPELGDTAAQPTDMAAGKVLYDDDGNPVTGTLLEESALVGLAKQPDSVSENADHSEIYITSRMYTPHDFIGRSTVKFRARVPSTGFGNAAEDQVLEGFTFTSGAGLLARGKHVCKGVELPELTNPASASDIANGMEVIGADGTPITGTFSLDTELSTQDNLIAQIQTALQGKTAEPPAYSEEWTFTMENGSTVTKEVFVGWTSQA